MRSKPRHFSNVDSKYFISINKMNAYCLISHWPNSKRTANILWSPNSYSTSGRSFHSKISKTSYGSRELAANYQCRSRISCQLYWHIRRAYRLHFLRWAQPFLWLFVILLSASLRRWEGGCFDGGEGGRGENRKKKKKFFEEEGGGGGWMGVKPPLRLSSLTLLYLICPLPPPRGEPSRKASLSFPSPVFLFFVIHPNPPHSFFPPLFFTFRYSSWSSPFSLIPFSFSPSHKILINCLIFREVFPLFL